MSGNNSPSRQLVREFVVVLRSARKLSKVGFPPKKTMSFRRWQCDFNDDSALWNMYPYTELDIADMELSKLNEPITLIDQTIFHTLTCCDLTSN